MVKYVYNEPSEYNGNCTVVRTEDEVLAYMKNMYMQRHSHTPNSL
jgi:hypothetical protein